MKKTHIFVILDRSGSMSAIKEDTIGGLENASKENTSADMKKLVERLTDKGNWTFTYLGANQDAWNTAKNWGFSSSNVSSYNATAKGVGETFAAASFSTQGYTRSTTSSTDSFFSQDQKDKLENTK